MKQFHFDGEKMKQGERPNALQFRPPESHFLFAVIAEQAMPDVLDFMDSRFLPLITAIPGGMPVGAIPGMRLAGGNPNAMVPVVRIYSKAPPLDHQKYRDGFDVYMKGILAEREAKAGAGIRTVTPEEARNGGVSIQ